MLDDQKMLQMIASEPLILAVRLADKFDCDIDDVETALLPHLNRRVFVREVIAPNGRKAPAYVLSDEYRAIVLAGQPPRDPDVERRAEIRESAPGVNMDTAVEIQKEKASATPAKPTEPRITKPQMAIDFLTAAPGNRCTTKEMLAALGLPRMSSPNAYLLYATKDGRIKRDGQDWVLGNAKEASQAEQLVVNVAPPPTDSHEMLTFGQLSGIGDVNSSAKGSGARFNAGKPDFSLIPMSTLEDEAKVWMYGREKYAAWNWTKGMKWSVPFACAMRHMAAWQRGEECDPESGLPHLAHAMCNLRMLTLYASNFQQGDDRPTKELQP